MALVELRDLTKRYQTEAEVISVLEDVDLDIEAGEYLSLMGPSGSGKSTLLNLMAGLDQPDSGTITIDGSEITSLGPNRLADWRANHVGFVFQFYNLLPVLTAFQNVELPLLLTNLSKDERRERVEVALNVVNLSDRMEHYPRQLSGGQEQRVGIARAIVSDPVMILADEPTGDLDAASAEEILNLIERLNSEFNKTVLMVTHDQNAAERAHRMMYLEKGVLHQ